MTTINMARHEFIGKEIEVVGSTNKDLIGLRGKVVDETRDILVIHTEQGERKILKKDVVVKITVDNEEIIIQGDILVGRPEDRIKK